MHPSMFTTWLFALTLGALGACGAEGPTPSSGSGASDGGAADGSASGGATADGGAASAPDDDGGTGSGSGGSEDDEDDEPPPTCSIMSSNASCKSCLEENCCMVVHACLDEDLLGCVSCLDCYLSGDGPDCCDESVGKNAWLAECIAFNCEDAC